MFFPQYFLQSQRSDLSVKRAYTDTPNHSNQWRYYHPETFKMDEEKYRRAHEDIRLQPQQRPSHTEVIESAKIVGQQVQTQVPAPVTLPLISKKKFLSYSSKKRFNFQH